MRLVQNQRYWRHFCPDSNWTMGEQLLWCIWVLHGLKKELLLCVCGYLYGWVFSLYVDVCFKILPADICVCRKQLSFEWKTVSLSAVPDVGGILLSPVPNLPAAAWLDGGQWRCKQCSVPCSLLGGHPCGQEEQETAGCWCGSARYFCECLSSFSRPAFPFCRIICAATRRS